MKTPTLIAATFTALLMMVAAQSAPAAQAQDPINPADFSTAITNPLFPISLIGPKVLEGEDIDPDTDEVHESRLESRVLPQTKVVAGVTVTVLEEKAFEDGQLIELALDYFAQHKDGSVYYFGEDVDNYEDGKLKDHHGAWLAGVDGNTPGIIMPARPVVGVTLEQELAPGVAEDKATILAINETVTVPAGTYIGCMKTREFTPLEPGIEEFKWHCPGVGMAKETGDGSLNELVSVGPAPAATPTARPAAPAPTARAGVIAPNTGDGAADGGDASERWMFAGALALAFGLGGVAVRFGTVLRR